MKGGSPPRTFTQSGSIINPKTKNEKRKTKTYDFVVGTVVGKDGSLLIRLTDQLRVLEQRR